MRNKIKSFIRIPLLLLLARCYLYSATNLTQL